MTFNRGLAAVQCVLGACAAGVPGEGAMDDAASTTADPADASIASADEAEPGRDASARDRAPADRKASADVVTYAPVKCAPGLLFCEDFEKGGLDPARWGFGFWYLDYYYTQPRGVAIDLDSGNAHEGSRSLRFRQMLTMDAQDRDGFVRTATRFTLGGNNLFVRTFIYIDDPTPNRWFPVFFVTDPTQDASKPPLWNANLVPISETVASRSAFQVGTDIEGKVLAAAVPTGRWACWELEIRGTRKEFLLYVDGKLVPGADFVSSHSPDAVQFNFGYLNGHDDIIKHPPDGFFDVWFDEIAVGSERIGCTPP